MMKRVNKFFLITIFFLAIGADLWGETYTWIGNGGTGLWNNSGNWQGNKVAPEDDNTSVIVFNSGCSQYPEINDDIVCKSLINNGELDFYACKITGDIKNTGTMNINAYTTLTIDGDLINTGTITSGSGAGLRLEPTNTEIKITGTNTATDTKLHNLTFPNGAGKKLIIDGKIKVNGSLELKGSSTSNRLTINGTNTAGGTSTGEILVNANKTGSEYLAVYTNNIKISDGTCQASGSISYKPTPENPSGSGVYNGWKFGAGAGGVEPPAPTNPNETKWKVGAGTNDWNTSANWSNGVPTATKKAIIPAITGKYPILASNVVAKEVEIQENGKLHLKTYRIMTTPGGTTTTKLVNKGTLILQGRSEQTSWFTASESEAISLLGGNTTVIYDNDDGAVKTIWKGPYDNLGFDKGTQFRSSDDISVEKSTIVTGPSINLRSKLKTKDLIIKSSGYLAASANIELSGDFTNEGEFSTSTGAYGTYKLTLDPTKDHKITGTTNPDDTQFGHLVFENAGGKTLTIEKNIEITKNLYLSGIDVYNLLTIKSSGTGPHDSDIKLISNKVIGKFLNIATNDVWVQNKNYRVKDSSSSSLGVTPTGPQNGWDFLLDDATSARWTGAVDDDWNNAGNWITAPNTGRLPGFNTDVTIKATTSGGGAVTIFPKLKNTTSAEAKSVTIEAGAELDLDNYIITKSSTETAELTNKGTLRLTGTSDTGPGTLNQKSWLDHPSTSIIAGTSTVVYYGMDGIGGSKIHAGNYNNLIIESGKTISADSAITVQNMTTINGTVTLNTQLNSKDLTVEGGNKLTANAPINITNDFLAKGEAAFNADLRVDNKLTNQNLLTLNANLTVKTFTTKGSFMTIDDASKLITVEGDFENTNSGTATIDVPIKFKANFTNNGSFTAKKDVQFSPTGTNFSITGTLSEESTKFANLSMTNLAYKSLSMRKKIKIVGNLLLSGTSSGKFIIDGSDNAQIHILSSQAGGTYLNVKTANIYINDGLGSVKYSVSNSLNLSGTNMGVHKGWDFGTPTTPSTAEWTGDLDSNWNSVNNWDTGVPGTNTVVTIPVVGSGKSYPDLTGISSEALAESVTVANGATLDLADQVIKTAGGETAKVIVEGTLRLAGTDGSGGATNQIAWFKEINVDNRIVLAGTSTLPSIVEYYGTSSGKVWNGEYHILKIASGKTIQTETSTGLKVNENFENDGTFTLAADMEIVKTFTNNGTFNANAKKVTFTGASAEISNGSATSTSFHDLEIASGATTINKAITVSNNLNTANVSSLTANQAITVSKNFTNAGTTTTNADINIDGILTNVGSYNANANVTVGSNFVNALSTSNFRLNGNMTVTANFVNAGTFTANSGTITLTNASHNIQGDATDPSKTTFNNLRITGADNKTLKIKDKIKIQGNLNLSGTDGNPLKVIGESGAVTLANPSHTGTGKFLKANTTSVKFTSPTVYKIYNSTDNNNQRIDKNGWLFCGDEALTWTGATNDDWFNVNNWEITGTPGAPANDIPASNTVVTISTGNPTLGIDATKQAKAKTVTVSTGASLNLASKQITTSNGFTTATAKVTVEGTLRLTGTDEQKSWFENPTTENKMTVDAGKSTVVYYGTSTSTIWKGEYYNLTIQDSKTISTDSSTAIEVSGSFESTGNTTLNSDMNLKGDFTNSGTFTASNGTTVSLSPGNSHTITGTTTAGDTSVANLSMENAGGQSLTIQDKITVTGTLSLTGTKSGSISYLEINGTSGDIHLSNAQSGGQYLNIHTATVHIDKGTETTYPVKDSLNNDGPESGNQNGWLFSPEESRWTGADTANFTDWNDPDNWDNGVPTANTIVTIPRGLDRIKYPVLASGTNAKAKIIIIEAESSAGSNDAGILDLAGYLIKTTVSKNATITNNGILKLTGKGAQQSWFGTGTNEISLIAGSTVEYYNTATANDATIWTGTYHNLRIAGGKTVSTKISGTLTVNGNFENAGTTNLITDMSLAGNFTNTGTFTTSTGKTVTLSTANNHTITATVNEANTQFTNLKMGDSSTGAGGQTLTISNKISVTGNLLLNGTDTSQRLTINGNSSAEIHLNASQNDNGQYLIIFTDNVKINDGLNSVTYMVKNSKDNANGIENKNGWIFFKDNIKALYSFAKPGSNILYIAFNQELPANEFNVGTEIQIGSGASSAPTANEQLTNKKLWKFTLTANIELEDILDKTKNITITHNGTSFNTKHISDIGFGLIKVLNAANSKVIHKFDASESLPKTETIITTVPTQDLDKFVLYFSSEVNKNYWMPSDLIGITTNPLNGININTNHNSPTGTVSATQKKFTVQEDNAYFKANTTAEFMFVFDNWLPCARLDESTSIFQDDGTPNFDIWKFKVEAVKHQAGGASIFNNVLNTSKDEKTSVKIKLKQNGILTIQVMTLDGSIVRTIERSNKNAGVHLYHWDGKNNAGNSVARGMYFIRIAGPNIDEIRKVLVIK